jgi:hypothetical protein
VKELEIPRNVTHCIQYDKTGQKSFCFSCPAMVDMNRLCLGSRCLIPASRNLFVAAAQLIATANIHISTMFVYVI